MLTTSKKQQWILEMIKGPDIAPVGGQPGCYTSKAVIGIATDTARFIIGPSDLMDLSDSEFLRVLRDGQQFTIAWENITAIDFREEKALNSGAERRSRLNSPQERTFSFLLGKRSV